jgi:aspartate/methionine/tyrosine aminotransferase
MNTMFSQRTEWELTPNRITGILEDLKKSNQRIFDLTESNPTNCGFSYLTQDLQGALMNPDNMRYSPATKGLAASRDAVAKYYESKGISISPEQIFLTSSTSEGYSFLFRLLADPGNNILFPSPSYPLFEFLVGLNDIEMNYYPLMYTDQWAIDFGELRNLITPLTSAIVLVNPNNPTGSFIIISCS